MRSQPNKTREPHLRRGCAPATALVALAALAAWAPAAVASHAHRPRAHVSVVGGAQASAGTWPWLAFVADVQNGTACSGTIVSPLLVLTAAHCVEDLTAAGSVATADSLRVVTGTLDWSAIGSGQVLTVSRVAVDPAFNPATLDGDAALLILSSPTRSPSIKLAGTADSSLLTAGVPAAIAGWGYTYAGEPSPPTSLYWGSTVVQSATYCLAQGTLDGVPFNSLDELCAADAPSFAVASCHGDSGGPLLATAADGGPVEIGITSRGDPACNPSYPSVFTRADSVSGWVTQWIAATPAPPATSTSASAAAPPPSTVRPASVASSASTAAAPRTSVRTAPARPRAGPFTGAAGQYGGHLALTVARARVTFVRLTFSLRCARRRGAMFSVSSTRVATIGITGGEWRFSDVFTDQRGWRYVLYGVFTAPRRVAGTLIVTTADGTCSSGRVSWIARA